MLDRLLKAILPLAALLAAGCAGSVSASRGAFLAQDPLLQEPIALPGCPRCVVYVEPSGLAASLEPDGSFDVSLDALKEQIGSTVPPEFRVKIIDGGTNEVLKISDLMNLNDVLAAGTAGPFPVAMRDPGSDEERYISDADRDRIRKLGSGVRSN